MKNISRTLNAAVVGIALSSLTMVLPAHSQLSNTTPNSTTTSPDTTTTTTSDYRGDDDGFDLGWLGLLGLIGLAGLKGKKENHTYRQEVNREPSTTNYTDFS